MSVAVNRLKKNPQKAQMTQIFLFLCRRESAASADESVFEMVFSRRP